MTGRVYPKLHAVKNPRMKSVRLRELANALNHRIRTFGLGTFHL